MERTIVGLVIGVIVFGVVVAGRSLGTSSASEECRLTARDMITHVEGYDTRPDYFDWLVDVHHEAAFDKSTHRERTGRRRSRLVIDEEKYLYELCTLMMRQAGSDKVTHVAANIQQFRDDNFNDPDGRKPTRPRAAGGGR